MLIKTTKLIQRSCLIPLVMVTLQGKEGIFFGKLVDWVLRQASLISRPTSQGYKWWM